MCGRYTFMAEPDEIADLFEVEVKSVLRPRYNIAPTQAAAAVRLDKAAGRRELTLMRWGLVPSWAKDLSIGARMINARAESLAEKPAFREALLRRRCLVPASGFYEWKKIGAKKQPYYFQAHDKRPFAFAGLWERWQPAGKDAIESYAIVTTRANVVVADIHDRMPVIIALHDYAAWLQSGELAPEVLARLLGPAPDGFLVKLSVSTWVNTPAHDDPGCIRP